MLPLIGIMFITWPMIWLVRPARIFVPVSWQLPAVMLLIVTKSPTAEGTLSKMQPVCPAMAICALPVVPALPTTTPIMPSVSPVVPMVTVLAPYILASLLSTVAVELFGISVM